MIKLDTDSTATRWKCPECGHIVSDDEMLTARNPFNYIDTIYGCPNCWNVVEFRDVCDEPECEEIATCGFPNATGYRRTCGKHMRAARK